MTGHDRPRERLLLMLCDKYATKCALAVQSGERSEKPRDVVKGVQAGCFPALYIALAGNPPDQVITADRPASPRS